MRRDLLLKHTPRVPRYTSYPTAPHFHPGVDAETYRDWLADVAPDALLSLYLHIPFCDSLCWFCGCHTKLVRRYEPISAYLGLIQREIELVANILPSRPTVRHLHWGGGTPTILKPRDLLALAERLRGRFDLGPKAEFAVEIDPRGLTPGTVWALAQAGVNRASLGVQDVNPEVQRAVNRWQPFAVTAQAVDWLRQAGIEAINMDLMYGLPFQTVGHVIATTEAVLKLSPQRIALFGYAHVPWIKRHQRLIDEAALPDCEARLGQYEAAAARLKEAGYVAIGLDHFAQPDDSLAVALREGRLRRNFQGYTSDDSPLLLGFGTSAIGTLPQGYAQNAVPMRAYAMAIQAGTLAVVRGVALEEDDRLRREVIERLMCDLSVDLADTCRRYARAPDTFAPEIRALAPMVSDGLVCVEGQRVRISEDARSLLRVVCAVFDRYLESGEARHSQAV